MIKIPKLENIEIEFFKHDGVEYDTQEKNSKCPLIFFMHMPISKDDVGVYGISKFLNLAYKLNVYMYSFNGGRYVICIEDNRALGRTEILCKKTIVLKRGEWYKACIGVCKTWNIKNNGYIAVKLISAQNSVGSKNVKMHVKFYKDQ